MVRSLTDLIHRIPGSSHLDSSCREQSYICICKYNAEIWEWSNGEITSTSHPSHLHWEQRLKAVWLDCNLKEVLYNWHLISDNQDMSGSLINQTGWWTEDTQWGYCWWDVTTSPGKTSQSLDCHQLLLWTIKINIIDHHTATITGKIVTSPICIW